jgi:hypothetical protein
MKRKRGDWVVTAVAGGEFINKGVRHLRGKLYRGEALSIKKRWTKQYPDLIIAAEPWR